MPLYKAGQEIDAFCTKCKMDLLHRIIAEVKGKPVKVECRTCYTSHVYRAPKNATSPGVIPPPAPSVGSSYAASTGTAKPAASRARKTVEPEAPVVPPDHATIHQYRMTEKFVPDMWLMHKTFGTGLVVREVGPDKIEVRFDGGNRVLVHGKTE